MMKQLFRTSRILLVVVASAATGLAHAAENSAASYPNRPVRVIVPYTPGGSSDAVARLLGQKLGELLGQQFVIDNRGGAAGSIGREVVAKATPDGYTLLVGDSPHTINVHVLRHVPYDPVRDFTPISLVATASQVFVVNPGFPSKTLKEFIAAAAAQPGKINYGSGGSGSITHLTGELFKLAAHIDLTHVPYKSIANAITDVIAGQVPAAFPTMPSAVPHVKAGRLRALAVSSAKRSNVLPDVPTFEGGGVRGMIVNNWFGVFGPARLPREIVAKLHGAVIAALNSPDVRSRMSALSLEIVGSTPQEFDKHVRAELEKWGKVVKAAGIKPE
jgi:tripartite-type tricarboxylate transporter receptor subunit TctC